MSRTNPFYKSCLFKVCFCINAITLLSEEVCKAELNETACMCAYVCKLLNGHRDGMCTYQQEAVIRNNPCRVLRTFIGRRKTASLCWLGPDSTEQFAALFLFFNHQAVHVLPAWGKGSQIKSPLPTNPTSCSHCVADLTGFFLFGRNALTNDYILLSLEYVVLSHESPLFHW